MAQVKNYTLYLAPLEGNKSTDDLYYPRWDTYVNSLEAKELLVQEINYLLAKGVIPVVTIFTPK